MAPSSVAVFIEKTSLRNSSGDSFLLGLVMKSSNVETSSVYVLGSWSITGGKKVLGNLQHLFRLVETCRETVAITVETNLSIIGIRSGSKFNIGDPTNSCYFDSLRRNLVPFLPSDLVSVVSESVFLSREGFLFLRQKDSEILSAFVLAENRPSSLLHADVIMFDWRDISSNCCFNDQTTSARYHTGLEPFSTGQLLNHLNTLRNATTHIPIHIRSNLISPHVSFHLEPESKTDTSSVGNCDNQSEAPEGMWCGKAMSNISNTVDQISWRFGQIRSLVSMKHRSSVTSRADILSSIFVDVLLGVLAFLILRSDGNIEAVSRNLQSSANMIAESLQQLLQWMMGVPAGLKLNRPLAHFLARCFGYHVHLWLSWLNLFWPWSETALSVISPLGFLGLSFMVSVFCDILSIMTMHVYCFYVYASRIYSLQLKGLISFWRLFQGKKFNPLRNRIDSCDFTISQLFVGTVVFTILLFLLPTTALFYIVFTAVRIMSLIVQTTLNFILQTLNTLPLFSIMKWIFGSEKMTGNFNFRVVSVKNEIMVLEMRGRYKPFHEAVPWPFPSSISRSQDGTDSWSNLGKNILTGTIIYPWFIVRKR